MISRLLVENFKSLQLLDVELGSFALVVGANGCGKSNLLEALALTRALGEMRVPELPASCLSRAATGALMLRVENDGASRSWIAEPGTLPECIELGDEGELRRLAQLERYALRHEQLAAPSRSAELWPRLGSRGEGLAELLDALWSLEPERFAALEHAMRAMIPGLQGFRSTRCAAQQGPGDANTLVARSVVFDYAHAKGIAARDTSEGVVLLLGVLAALCAATREPATLLIDDLDRGLHPRVAAWLVTHLREAVAAHPQLQIIATSRSPALTEALDYDEVLVMACSPTHSVSHIAALSTHPEATTPRGRTSCAQLLARIDESWPAVVP